MTSNISDLINLAKVLCCHQLNVHELSLVQWQRTSFVSALFHHFSTVCFSRQLSRSGWQYQYRDNVIGLGSQLCRDPVVTTSIEIWSLWASRDIFRETLTTCWQQKFHDLKGSTIGPRTAQGHDVKRRPRRKDLGINAGRQWKIPKTKNLCCHTYQFHSSIK